MCDTRGMAVSVDSTVPLAIAGLNKCARTSRRGGHHLGRRRRVHRGQEAFMLTLAKSNQHPPWSASRAAHAAARPLQGAQEGPFGRTTQSHVDTKCGPAADAESVSFVFESQRCCAL